MAAPDRPVPILVGPTAVGKTAVAVALGGHWPVTVVSADSRQVYRGLDIGTAKPDPAVRARVPHLGLDLVAPGERYSAGRFARDAAAWLRRIGPDGMPLVVGGTGLYVKGLTEGLFREPALDGARRERLRRWAANAAGLGRWAARLDPAFSGGGRQREARAVEVALLTGRPLSWWQRRAGPHGSVRPWYIRLTAPREVLHRRIDERADAMLAQGWIDEVAGLLDEGVAPDAPGLDGVGYREIVRMLTGGMARGELRGAIVTATRRYAKRQETWFRHQLRGPVLTLHAVEPAEALAETIVARWKERGH